LEILFKALAVPTHLLHQVVAWEAHDLIEKEPSIGS